MESGQALQILAQSLFVVSLCSGKLNISNSSLIK